ncbi:uncharacterized protein LOC100379079 [Saccoglossus kowalevskii]
MKKRAALGIVPPASSIVPPTLGIVPPTLGIVPPTLGIVPSTLGIVPPTLGIVPTDLGIDPTDTGIVPPDLDIDPTDMGIVPATLGIVPPILGTDPPDMGIVLPINEMNDILREQSNRTNEARQNKTVIVNITRESFENEIINCYKTTGNKINALVSVQGSFNQGHPQFLYNSGRQCVANSLVSILYSKIKLVFSWDTFDLDTILRTGNELYGFLQQSSTCNDAYLLVTELPEIIELFDLRFALNIAESLSGIIGKSGDFNAPLMAFNVALEITLRDHDACIVIFGGAAFSVLKNGDTYWIFDPHARDSKGMVEPDGKSVLLQCRNVEVVYEHCCNLAVSMHVSANTQFEVTGISANVEEYMECQSEDEVLVVSTDHIPLLFSPLSLELCESLCFQLGIKNIRKTEVVYSDQCNEIENATEFYGHLRPGYKSVSDYLVKSRMENLRIWATEVEIVAAAHLLRTDIYTFSQGRWLKYSSTQIDKNIINNEKGIYLNHCMEIHYEVVECVKMPGVLTSVCTHNTNSSTISEVGRSKRSLQTVGHHLSDHNIDQKISNKQHKCEKKVSTDTCTSSVHVGQILKRKGKRANDRLRRILYHLKKKTKQCEEPADDHSSIAKKWKLKKEVERYHTDDQFQEKKKLSIITRYRKNNAYKAELKEQSIQKYAQNESHRLIVKEQSIKKYAQNESHQAAVKKRGIQKYAQNESTREETKLRVLATRQSKVNSMKNIDKVTNTFRNEIANGPKYVCSVCHRRLFRDQVLFCKQEMYFNKGGNVSSIAEKCITKDYVHECTNTCDDNCLYLRQEHCRLWICFTCHRKLLKGKMPAEAVANNLYIKPIPEELKCLNSLEQHLICLHIPFMKMLALPKGGQNGVHGPVVCVPSSVEKVTSILPRFESDDQMIRVKLKRKLTYKGHYQYQFVNDVHIRDALHYLKTNNKWYSDICFNENWRNPLLETVEDNEPHHENDASNVIGSVNEDDENIDTEHEEQVTQQQGMFLDTCLQPVDIAQEVLDHHYDTIQCVAPAEGNNPVQMLMDETNEAKSFPALYPTGSPTFYDKRDERITLARYLHMRLMNADGRFAKNTDFIFYAQYLSEVQQVVSNVSIALRKGSGKACGKKVTSATLTDAQSLKEILNNDEGFKFLKPIRGTPPFWQSTQKDLFAMLRQLGIPTWFCSFSSADMRWPEFIEAILSEQGDTRTIEELDWSEKCAILRNNPVTAARMFDHRFHCFLKHVIMSPAEPIGEIVDYFYRVEFQQRGSPHTHCLFWVKDAPRVDDNEDIEVTEFVDKYITCGIPSEESDDELFEIVNSVQKHSMRHSKSCRKQGTSCRFNFPRPPSKETFIARVDNAVTETTDVNVNLLDEVNPEYNDINADYTEMDQSDSKQVPKLLTTDEAKAILTKIWNELSNPEKSYLTVESLFTKREMGLLLGHAQKEASKEGNTDAKLAMKQLGGVYLTNREVCAQEAVYRVCNLRLKEGSRKVQFIPTGDNPIKMSLPLRVLQMKNKDRNLNKEDIWMTSLLDRYKSRPNEEIFDNLCLASFVSEYRVVSTSEIMGNTKSNNAFVKLQNGLGYVRKRTRTDAAVVRYARFSPFKYPEKYYQSILQLFLPHRTDSQLKPCNFDSFEDFYQTGAVKYACKTLETVKAIVDRNRALFEKEVDEIDAAEQILEACPPLEDAWAQIHSQSEMERLQCQEMVNNISLSDEAENDDSVPDLLGKDKTNSCAEVHRQCGMSRNDAKILLRSLNDKQQDIFYTVRQWCLNKTTDHSVQAFYMFLCGGAGTGKSHLIKALYYEASRILSRVLPNPDNISVLLTAPTGVAAFNIDATTIHSTFSIAIDAKLPYQPLGEEKINTLRTKLGSLQILIIDEISMVDKKLLAYIHGRLRQIKQSGDYSPFGGVSVVAVGDFYQLPPVKGKALYFNNEGVDLWNDYFSIAELSDIVRQEDYAFAETLNVIRSKKKSDDLDTSAVNMLRQCETGEDGNGIHIFATNKEVNECNVMKLQSSCTDPITIKAQDFCRDPKTKKLVRQNSQHKKIYNTNLANTVTLAVGARVMLTKNIDVSDGLVNGVFGTVSYISMKPGEVFPSTIYVVFDNENVGTKLRSKTDVLSSIPENSLPIMPQEDRVNSSGSIRRQFPLKLAWACTVHKVQGLTVEEAVVSLDKIFAPGQAYVALSRVKSLSGLVIKDFKESAIYCNEKIDAALSSMPKFITLTENLEYMAFYVKDGHFTVAIIYRPRSYRADVFRRNLLSLVEELEKLPGGSIVLGDFNENVLVSSSVQKLMEERGFKQCVAQPTTDSDLEYMAFYVKDGHFTVAIIYRPQSYRADIFRRNLLSLVEELEKLPGGSIVLGDFNENVLVCSSVQKLMEERGFKQCVAQPTTDSGTLIDHAYVRHTNIINVEVIQTYFGSHNAVCLKV